MVAFVFTMLAACQSVPLFRGAPALGATDWQLADYPLAPILTNPPGALWASPMPKGRVLKTGELEQLLRGRTLFVMHRYFKPGRRGGWGQSRGRPIKAGVLRSIYLAPKGVAEFLESSHDVQTTPADWIHRKRKIWAVAEDRIFFGEYGTSGDLYMTQFAVVQVDVLPAAHFYLVRIVRDSGGRTRHEPMLLQVVAGDPLREVRSGASCEMAAVPWTESCCWKRGGSFEAMGCVSRARGWRFDPNRARRQLGEMFRNLDQTGNPFSVEMIQEMMCDTVTGGRCTVPRR